MYYNTSIFKEKLIIHNKLLKLSVVSTIAITGITTIENIQPKITNASQKIKTLPKSYQGKWYFNVDPDVNDAERNFDTLVIKKDKITWISSTNGGVMKYKFKVNGKSSKGFKLKPISKKPFPGNDYSLKITNDLILFNYGSGKNTFCKDKTKYIKGNSGPKYPLNSTESIDSDYYMVKKEPKLNKADDKSLSEKYDADTAQVDYDVNHNQEQIDARQQQADAEAAKQESIHHTHPYSLFNKPIKQRDTDPYPESNSNNKVPQSYNRINDNNQHQNNDQQNNDQQ